MSASHLRTAFRLVLILLVAGPLDLRAQAARSVFPSVAPAMRSSEHNSLRAFVSLPDSVVYPATYWKEGLFIAGGLAGLLGAAFAVGFCANGEGGGENCGLKAIGGFVLLGGAGGTIGALIGGSIPKSDRFQVGAVSLVITLARAARPREAEATAYDGILQYPIREDDHEDPIP